MGESVVADFVAFPNHPRQKLRMRFRVFSDDEEDRGDVIFFQHIQHFRREHRVRTVVKRQNRAQIRVGVASAEMMQKRDIRLPVVSRTA